MATKNENNNQPLSKAVVFAVLAIIGFSIYANSLKGPFIYDDTNIILANPVIKSLSNFMALPWPRYMTNLTFALNYAIHGYDVFGYHFLNVAIHVANAFLVYRLSSQLTQLPAFDRGAKEGLVDFIPFSVSIIFLVHPIQTGAVSYITQRFTLLAAFFYLLTATLYIRARTHRQDGAESYEPRYYFGSIVAMFLGQLAKENSFTIPVMLAIMEFGLFRGEVKKRLLRLIPFFSLFVIVPLALIVPALHSNKDFFTALTEDPTLRQLTYMNPYSYILTQFRVTVTYLRLLFYPSGLRIIYDYPVYDTFFTPQVYLSFLFLSTLLAGAIMLLIRSRKRSNGLLAMFSFGIIWFFVTNIVEALTPLIDVIFEHRVYLPGAGIIISFFAILSYSINLLLGKTENARHARTVFLGASVLITLVFAISAHFRNDVWTDGMKFWQDAAKKSPATFTTLSNLGSEYVLIGNYDKAIDLYRKALPVAKPYNRTLAYSKLASTLLLVGKYDESIELSLEAMKFTDDPAKTLLNLGFAFAAKKEYKRALSAYNEVIRLEPKMEVRASAYEGIGNIMVEKRRYDEAIGFLKRAIELNAQVSDYHYNLAGAYMLKGDKGNALKYFKQALKLSPGDPEARNAVNILSAEMK